MNIRILIIKVMQIFEDIGLSRVLQFATKAHEGQKRKYSDEDYISHPIEVAKMVHYRSSGSVTMTAAALLHDVLEDTKVTHSELRLFLHKIFLSNKLIFLQFLELLQDGIPLHIIHQKQV